MLGECPYHDITVPTCKYICRPQYGANDWDERGETKGEGKVKSLFLMGDSTWCPRDNQGHSIYMLGTTASSSGSRGNIQGEGRWNRGETWEKCQHLGSQLTDAISSILWVTDNTYQPQSAGSVSYKGILTSQFPRLVTHPLSLPS